MPDSHEGETLNALHKRLDRAIWRYYDDGEMLLRRLGRTSRPEPSGLSRGGPKTAVALFGNSGAKSMWS